MRIVVKHTGAFIPRSLFYFGQISLVLGFLFLGLWAAGMLEGTVFQAYGDYELTEATTARLQAHQVSADYATGRIADFARTHPARGDVIGKLEIPRLELSVVVFEGTTETQLRRGAGRIKLTGFPGDQLNIGIAAHRNTFFRPLEEIQEGDRIWLRTPYGAYEYEVAITWIIDPSRTQVLNPNIGDALTLVTCYPFEYVGNAPNRFIVRAVPVPTEEPG